MLLRILAVTILLLSVLFMPFWVSVILTIAGIAYFSNFFEGAVLLLLSDLLFGLPEAKFYNLVFLSCVFAIISVFLAEFIKKKLKFYN